MQFLFVAGGGATELPDVVDGAGRRSVVRVADGHCRRSIVDVLRDVPDSASLFDSAIAPYMFGTSRAMLEMMYVGRADRQLPPECCRCSTMTQRARHRCRGFATDLDGAVVHIDGHD